MNNNVFKNHFEFADFDQFANLISQVEQVEHHQLDKGRFKARLTKIAYGPVIIGVHKSNRILLQETVGTPGYTTFLLANRAEQGFIWRKNSLTGNNIGILREGMEHSSITPNNFYAAHVSIENVFLEEFLEIMGHENLMEIIGGKETINIDLEDKVKIFKLVEFLCENDIKDPTIVKFDLPELIVNTLAKSFTGYRFKKDSVRVKLFKKTQEIIHTNYENKIQIYSLCKQLGISERNLRYTFTKHAGMSPKKYIKHYRLNKVRKLIVSGKYEKIVEASHDVGFWQSGKFAADYKLLFGEFPSDTLKIKR